MIIYMAPELAQQYSKILLLYLVNVLVIDLSLIEL